MATASASICRVAITAAAATAATTTATRKPKPMKVNYVSGLNSFGGLKAHNSVVSLGTPVCTEQAFGKVVSSLRSQRKGNGGALSSSCNAVDEIFRIAAIMNGLVLVGVAVGFVLLRIEAWVEESEA